MERGDRLLMDLDAAVLRFLGAKHAALEISYDDPDADEAGPSIVYESIAGLRDAAQAILDHWGES